MTENVKNKGLTPGWIAGIVAVILFASLIVPYGIQYYLDNSRTPPTGKAADKKTEYEISKLDAEISRIKSDTVGSLFWLKLVALFVTVGGAVGGYLVGQSRTTVARINFEDRKNVDEVYQSIVQELAAESPILRAAAAVKLGSILKSFPAEWNVSKARVDQILQLTKQVMAAALSIEHDQKVLKTLTINIALHKTPPAELIELQGLDLSGAKAEDAYWARCNFSNADFYTADLSRASFRKSDLSNTQYRESKLSNAVFTEATCVSTNFKMADLRGATFERATLKGVNFEDAKVHGVILKGAIFEELPTCKVDVSEKGDRAKMLEVNEWVKLAQTSASKGGI